MSRMPLAAAMPTMPWCSTERSSRIGRNSSTPSSRIISKPAIAISPACDPHGPQRQPRRGAAGDRRCR